MAKRQKVDQTLKQNVVILHKKNFSVREIAVKVKRSKSVVGRILKLYSDLGHIPTARKTGRQRITSKREGRIIQRVALKNRFETAAGISRKVCETNNIKVSRKTVSRRLEEIGLFAQSPLKKPLISKNNKKARLYFANKHVILTSKNWAKVFFSDESKFNLFTKDGNNYVRRRTGENLNRMCTKKTVKFGGGSVMVLGMISSKGTTAPIRLNVRVIAVIYKNIIKDHVVLAIANSGTENAVFMQDNVYVTRLRLS
ncbi:Transposase Tc1-like [Trinorchestia longiramus]|nr:Transposase Tc1-like [Trinorchestia longiramus]